MTDTTGATLVHRLPPLAGRSVPPCKVSIDEIAGERKIGTILKVARGKTIFADGDDAIYTYKMMEGAVRLSKFMLDGRRQITEFVLHDDMFGFENGDTYSLSAESVTAIVIVRYRRSQIENLGEEFCDVHRELLAHLRKGWTSAQAHLVMLGRQSAGERVAAFLVSLANRQGIREGNLDLPMGRQDIADYLGLTIETVCRSLTDLKTSRVLVMPDRHHLIIRNFNKLERLLENHL